MDKYIKIPSHFFGLTEKTYITDGKKYHINHAEICMLGFINGFDKFYGSNALIASELNLSTRTIEKYLTELSAIGIVKRLHTRDNANKTMGRIIILNHDLIKNILLQKSENFNF